MGHSAVITMGQDGHSKNPVYAAGAVWTSIVLMCISKYFQDDYPSRLIAHVYGMIDGFGYVWLWNGTGYVWFCVGMASWYVLVQVGMTLPVLQLETSPSHRFLSYLSTVGIFNLLILAGVLCCVGFTRMSVCALVYVSSTSFRSIFPQSVTSRTTLRDYSPFSTAFNDRTLATVGELAFTYQLTLHFGMPFELVYMISVAQTVCWIAVLTGYPILHAIENSIWALLSCAIFFHSSGGDTMIQAGCVVFCAYIVLGDIPLYLSKKSEPKSVSVSLREITTASELDESWDFWSGEVPWMSGYFTFGAWMSLMMATTQ